MADKPQWTREQQRVIEEHGKNILVSAAAGSGKTAVLTERIVQMLENPSHLVDVDHLVVVTFTRAAAAEMRERIGNTITEHIAERMSKPRSEERDRIVTHLHRQSTLLHQAPITTIDSFCLNILRSYHESIDLDPSFRVGDGNELALLEQDAMNELMEEYYSSGREDFLHLVECLAPERTDEKVEYYIQALYKASQSMPWPKKWLDSCAAVYHPRTMKELKASRVFQESIEWMREEAWDLEGLLQDALKIASDPEGSEKYVTVFEAWLEQVDGMTKAGDVVDFLKCAKEFDMVQFPKGKTSVPPHQKAAMKEIRDVVKARIEFYRSLEATMKDTVYGSEDCSFLAPLREQVDLYVELVKRYGEIFSRIKASRGIVDFSDIEHLALQVLMHMEGEEKVYHSVADELSAYYEEILIDEYQDSNNVQEWILTAISKERFGKHNLFMVGDVKQSIYRFRMANPELFKEKYHTYREDGRDGNLKIELKANFRSRATILEATNDVFLEVMKESFGGVVYDQQTKLYPMATFAKRPQEETPCELILIQEDEEKFQNGLEAEGVYIAKRIQKLVSDPDYTVWDKKEKCYRGVQFRDIVILMRGVKDVAQEYVKIFSKNGVPAITESKFGYFDTYEVSVVCNLLRIIDNPRQDIALASVLSSYFGGMNAKDLAKLVAKDHDTLYEALKKSKAKKALAFMKKLQEYRMEARSSTTQELLWHLIYDSGYYDYLGTMPTAMQKKANVDLLIEFSKTYESTSLQGLFDFIRYIDRIRKEEAESMGEASLNSETDDVVRIMTIHKSKGLEFPVVFLANTGKSFQFPTEKEKMLFDMDYGVAPLRYHLDRRTKETTIFRKIWMEKERKASIQEEQRLLYVAMTRAKEMLFITASDKCTTKIPTLQEKYGLDGNDCHAPLYDVELRNMSSYLEMIVGGLRTKGNHGKGTVPEPMVVREVTSDEDTWPQVPKDWCYVKESTMEEQKIADFTYEYPYEIIAMPVKMTVSQIKHRWQVEEEDGGKALEPENNLFLKRRRKKKEKTLGKNEGALRGTAFHTVLEYLDYNRIHTKEEIEAQIRELIATSRLEEEDFSRVDVDLLLQMLHTPLGKAMEEAYAEGKLYREKEFVMGIPANEIDPTYDAGHMIVVQGVIDAYFSYGNGIWLVDYKSDQVSHDDAGREKLKERHATQLHCYAKACEQILGQKVVRVSIFSLELGEEIRIHG
ncbi:MAG: helicase-exonuclease AddAB subunit AddA [Lachnospiraceae bacterium]|nr:helicase-exonuclease AddAB subunit AddA [Lachnospiraceae bacterium]